MSYISWLRAEVRGPLAFVLRHPKGVLAGSLLVTALAVVASARLGIQTNFVDLLPTDEPIVKEVRQLERLVGGSSFIVLTISTDTAPLVGPFFDRIAEHLAGHPDVQYVDYRPPLDFFRRAALLYLSLDELDRLVTATRRFIDRAKLQSVAVELVEPGDETFALADLEARYPAFLKAKEFYASDDGQLFVMLIKPHGHATDTARTTRLIADIDALVGASLPRGADLRVRLTGPYVKAVTQNAIVMADAKRISILSLVAMLGFLLAYFRQKRAVVIIGIPLILSTLWAMGTAYWCFGTLNFFTVSATAVLLGLSADFGIHLYSRYGEHRRIGLPTETALWRTFSDLGVALWAAAITTIVGFLALALSHFRAFHQFGIIIALGMFHCLLAMSTVFPALVILFARRFPERIFERPRPMPLTRMIRWTAGLAFRPAVFWIGIVAAGLSVIPIVRGGLRFDYNFANILGVQETRALDQAVDGIFHHSINPQVARAETAADAAAFARAVRAAKAAHAAEPRGTTIATAIALADFVPSQQAAKRERLTAIRALFTPAVHDALTPGERATYERFLPALDPAPVGPDDIPPTVRRKFRDRAGAVGRFLFIFPNFDPQDGQKFFRFVEEMRRVTCPECAHPVIVSGETVVFHEIVRRMFYDGRWVIAVSLAGVLVALGLAFRSARLTVVCFVPYLLGLLWMLGIMAACGIPFTLINLAVIPILLGIAIDYPIYLLQQSLHFGRGQLRLAFTAVSPPIFGSAITTIVGFSCLLLAQNGGARSFGLAAVIGLGTSCAATLLWFPAWLARREAHAVAQAIAIEAPAVAEAARR